MADPSSKKGAREARPDEQQYMQRVGTTLRGKWRLDAFIGLGGMAAVYASTHRNGQRAAIKILHQEFARDPKVTERFLMEGYVANRVGHPGCVSVLDDDTSENGEPFLVMELLEGETLRDYWKRIGRRVPPPDVLRIAAQILDCLEACHQQGVIHRDLKPANIFLTKASQVKLLDFGVAQLRYAMTSEGQGAPTAVGTPAYMSPEQAMGLSDQLDGRTDLFSVGAIIHALCTGRRINHGKSEQESLMMAATTPVPSVARMAPDLPLELISLIDKALAWDRRNRHGNAAEMRAAVLDALEKILQGGTPLIQSIPPSRAEESRPAASALDLEPRGQAARELLRQLEQALTSTRAGGLDHVNTQRALRAAHDTLGEMSRTGEPLRLEIRPQGWLAGRTLVWEPAAPHDAIAYNLYVAGVRSLVFEVGMPFEALRELCGVLCMDPERDLSSEDDLVTVLRQKNISHLSLDVAEAFTSGDATERETFYEEADELEELAFAAGKHFTERVEARDDANAAHPLALEEVVRAMYQTQLELPRDRWRARYIEAVVEGYIDAARNRDAHLLLSGLRRSAATLIGRGELTTVLAFHGELTQKIASRLSGNDVARLTTPLHATLFGGELLELVLDYLRQHPAAAASAVSIFALLSDTELMTVLGALRAGVPPQLREPLFKFVERVLPGHEPLVADVAASAEPEMALRLTNVLGRAGTPPARAALERLVAVDDLSVQTEARVLLAPSPEHAFAELGRQLENASAAIRLAALRALVRHSLRGAYPAVARQVRAATFHELATDERAELLRTLMLLSPEHGEVAVLEIVKKGGMFTAQPREVSRTVAAQVLGELSSADGTVESLRELSQARWGVSEETRAAAQMAATQIVARRGRGEVTS